MVLKRFLYLAFGLLSVDRRSTVCRAKLLCRSTERSTDMHQSAFVHLGRPGDRPTTRALLSAGSGDRPGWPTESLALWLETMISPTVENLTVGSRPAGRLTEDFLLYFLNGYILFCLFLGLFPTTLLGFLLMYSSPINSGIVEKLSNKISKFLIKILQVSIRI